MACSRIAFVEMKDGYLHGGGGGGHQNQQPRRLRRGIKLSARIKFPFS